MDKSSKVGRGIDLERENHLATLEHLLKKLTTHAYSRKSMPDKPNSNQPTQEVPVSGVRKKAVTVIQEFIPLNRNGKKKQCITCGQECR